MLDKVMKKIKSIIIVRPTASFLPERSGRPYESGGLGILAIFLLTLTVVFIGKYGVFIEYDEYGNPYTCYLFDKVADFLVSIVGSPYNMIFEFEPYFEKANFVSPTRYYIFKDYDPFGAKIFNHRDGSWQSYHRAVRKEIILVKVCPNLLEMEARNIYKFCRGDSNYFVALRELNYLFNHILLRGVPLYPFLNEDQVVWMRDPFDSSKQLVFYQDGNLLYNDYCRVMRSFYLNVLRLYESSIGMDDKALYRLSSLSRNPIDNDLIAEIPHSKEMPEKVKWSGARVINLDGYRNPEPILVLNADDIDAEYLKKSFHPPNANVVNAVERERARQMPLLVKE